MAQGHTVASLLTFRHIDQFEHLEGKEMLDLVAGLLDLDKEHEAVVHKGSVVLDA